MSKLKSAIFVAMNAIVEKKGPVFKQSFLSRLSPPMKKYFEAPIFCDWVELGEYSEDFLETAQLFFPDSKNGIFELGRMLAYEMIPTMYRPFMRIASVAFLFKRLSTLWKLNHSKGRIIVYLINPKLIEVHLRDFPELPEHQREFFRGSMTAMAELSRAKNPTVHPDYEDAQVWKWSVFWE